MTSPNETFRMLICGKNPEHLKAVSEAVRPEIEVTHKATTLETAISTIQSLSENKISLILMGGGFSPSDYEAARSCHPDAISVPWLRPDAMVMAAFREAVGNAGAGMGGPIAMEGSKGVRDGKAGGAREAFKEAIEAGGAGMGAPVSTTTTEGKSKETQGMKGLEEAESMGGHGQEKVALKEAIGAGGAGMGAPVSTSTDGGNRGGGPPQGAGESQGRIPAPPAHVVASRARKCIDEHIQKLREGKGKGEVWYF